MLDEAAPVYGVIGVVPPLTVELDAATVVATPATTGTVRVAVTGVEPQVEHAATVVVKPAATEFVGHGRAAQEAVAVYVAAQRPDEQKVE